MARDEKPKRGCLGSCMSAVGLLAFIGIATVVGVIVLGSRTPDPAGESPAPPSPAPAADPDLPRLPAEQIRQIYFDLLEAGLNATRIAGEKYPFDNMPAEPDANRRYLAKRQQVYEGNRRAGWDAVGRKYSLDAKALEAVDREGVRKRWAVRVE